jgi:tRNA dimethylallyltransferase
LERLFIHNPLCPAEIISADSMQVYRHMDIGTAKPSREDQGRIPHHLIDVRDPCEQFNAGEFVRLASEAAFMAASRNALPVVSGGAGFYLKNLVTGLPAAPPSDAVIRAALKEELRQKGALALMEELAARDPVSAGRIHSNDEYRLIRALEVLRQSGRPLSSFASNGAAPAGELAAKPFNFLILGLRRPREELYSRINQRCAAMFQAGLPGEVRRLFELGYTPLDPGLRAIGYREFFIRDETEPRGWRLSEDLPGVQALAAQNSRRYAKRQITFFASIPGITWIDCGGDEAETAEKIRQELKALPGRGIAGQSL